MTDVASPPEKAAVSAHRRWVGPLAPIAALIVLFAAGEGATRLAIFARYGDAKQGAKEYVDYAPYMISVLDKKVLDPPPARRPGAYRILIVGSSTAQRLDDQVVAAAFAPVVKRPVEVLNYAQGGYIINQELVLLLMHGLATKPDLLLTLDGVMDLVSMTKTGRAGIPYMNADLELAMHRPTVFAIKRLFKGSQLVNAVRTLYERRLEVTYQSDQALLAATVDTVVSGVEKFSRIAHGADIAHIAVLQPYLHLRKNLPAQEQGLSRGYAYRKAFMVGALEAMERGLRARTLAPSTTYVNAFAVCDAAIGAHCFHDESHLTDTGKKRLLSHIVREAVRAGYSPRG